MCLMMIDLIEQIIDVLFVQMFYLFVITIHCSNNVLCFQLVSIIFSLITVSVISLTVIITKLEIIQHNSCYNAPISFSGQVNAVLWIEMSSGSLFGKLLVVWAAGVFPAG